MINTFTWDANFEIDIPSVDNQHRHLVDLINQQTEKLLTGKLNMQERIEYLEELTAYTHYHFDEELKLMEASGLDRDFIRHHQHVHAQFINQIQMISELLGDNDENSMEVLQKYLYSWLIFHILGMDHGMGVQIDLVRQGVAPAEAARQVHAALHDNQVEPMLRALTALFDLLAEKNQALRDINATLEVRVDARTQELHAANAILASMSLTDTLTTLPNRRHAMEKLQLFWQEASIAQSPLACLMIDADYFKEVNDQHGHAAGDSVLKQLALSLQHAVRSDDFVARLGGDEFCVLCPATNLAGAMILAGHLLEAVAQIRVETGAGSFWKSSISIGVACRTAAMESPDELVKLADESLYQAKSAGRTCARSLQAA